jgi:Domain of unknown function (DUF4157)
MADKAGQGKAQQAAAPAQAKKAPARKSQAQAVKQQLAGHELDEQLDMLAPKGDSKRGIAQAGLQADTIPLPFQAEMEQRFGQSFGKVQAHAGPEAAEANAQLRAEAYALGNQIAFKSASPSREVVAHELAHTIQQSGGAGAVQMKSGGTADDFEEEADRAAASVVSGESAEVTSRAPVDVAGWWADGHREITRFAANKSPFFKDKPKAVNYTANNAGGIDAAYQSSVQNFLVYLGASGTAQSFFEWKLGVITKPKQRKREDEVHQKKVEDVQFRWDNLAFHWRLPAERPLHGEAGGYISNSGTAQNKGAVQRMLRQAFNFLKSGDTKKSLVKLADAAHAAEDRGSHGEGRPFHGHDPRINYPRQPDGKKNPHYKPGWDCDDPSKNSGGRAMAEGYALKVMNDFGELVNKRHDKKELNDRLRSLTKTSARPMGRKFRSVIESLDKNVIKGGVHARNHGSTMRDESHYLAMRKQVGDGENTSNADDNMKYFYEKGHMYNDLSLRMETFITYLDKGNLKKSEKDFHVPSHIADAAKTMIHYVGQDPNFSKTNKTFLSSHFGKIQTYYSDLAALIQDKNVFDHFKKSPNISKKSQVYAAIKKSTTGYITGLSLVRMAYGDHLRSGNISLGGALKIDVSKVGGNTEGLSNKAIGSFKSVVEELKSKAMRVVPTTQRNEGNTENNEPETTKAEEEKQKTLDSVFLQANVIHRELNSGQHGPKDIEKKFKLYTKLRRPIWAAVRKKYDPEYTRAAALVSGWIKASHKSRFKVNSKKMRASVAPYITKLLKHTKGLMR